MSVAVLERASPGERRRAAVLVAAVALVWVAAIAFAAGGHGGAATAAAHAHGHAAGHGALHASGAAVAGLHAHGAGAPGAAGLAALVVMWTAMMVAMMVPPEAPALAGQLRVRSGAVSASRAAGFFAGLLATWTAFAALAALLHWALDRRLLVDDRGVLASPVAAAALVGAIGLFQLTPLKRRCLERCRGAGAGEPLVRLGTAAALAAGLRHGTVSLGSCALLMLLPLGVGGMRFAPMAAVTALLVVEKLGRPGLVAARLAGTALVAWSVVGLARIA